MFPALLATAALLALIAGWLPTRLARRSAAGFAVLALAGALMHLLTRGRGALPGHGPRQWHAP